LSAPLPPRPFVYPVVDVGVLGPRPVGEAVAALARGGARILQLRAKDVSAGLFVGLAREAIAAAHGTGVLVLINDRPDIARIASAHGVHVGQDDLAPRDVRALLPAGALVGLSTHNPEEIEASGAQPVDYVAIGPVFPTASKSDTRPVVGLEMVRLARRLTRRPLAGRAVYIWHCDRSGGYSLYSQGVTNQNYLRGVQEADASGRVSFTSIFPGCYSGRWPHIHFEVYPSLVAGTNVANRVATSQIALPKSACDAAYTTAGYESSIGNLSHISLATDMVFSDGSALELATVSGSAAAFNASLTVAL
jgi:thiamine-phosphate diphosphorylase